MKSVSVLLVHYYQTMDIPAEEVPTMIIQPETVYIKYHSSNPILKKLREFKRKEYYCDLYLRAKTENSMDTELDDDDYNDKEKIEDTKDSQWTSIFVHSCVVAAGCTMLQKKIPSPKNIPVKPKRHNIRHVTIKYLELCMDFIYRKPLHVNKKDISTLKQAASTLGVYDLESWCVLAERHINETNLLIRLDSVQKNLRINKLQGRKPRSKPSAVQKKTAESLFSAGKNKFSVKASDNKSLSVPPDIEIPMEGILPVPCQDSSTTSEINRANCEDNSVDQNNSSLETTSFGDTSSGSKTVLFKGSSTPISEDVAISKFADLSNDSSAGSKAAFSMEETFTNTVTETRPDTSFVHSSSPKENNVQIDANAMNTADVDSSINSTTKIVPTVYANPSPATKITLIIPGKSSPTSNKPSTNRSDLSPTTKITSNISANPAPTTKLTLTIPGKPSPTTKITSNISINHPSKKPNVISEAYSKTLNTADQSELSGNKSPVAVKDSPKISLSNEMKSKSNKHIIDTEIGVAQNQSVSSHEIEMYYSILENMLRKSVNPQEKEKFNLMLSEKQKLICENSKENCPSKVNESVSSSSSSSVVVSTANAEICSESSETLSTSADPPKLCLTPSLKTHKQDSRKSSISQTVQSNVSLIPRNDTNKSSEDHQKSVIAENDCQELINAPFISQRCFQTQLATRNERMDHHQKQNGQLETPVSRSDQNISAKLVENPSRSSESFVMDHSYCNNPVIQPATKRAYEDAKFIKSIKEELVNAATGRTITENIYSFRKVGDNDLGDLMKNNVSSDFDSFSDDGDDDDGDLVQVNNTKKVKKKLYDYFFEDEYLGNFPPPSYKYPLELLKIYHCSYCKQDLTTPLHYCSVLKTERKLQRKTICQYCGLFLANGIGKHEQRHLHVEDGSICDSEHKGTSTVNMIKAVQEEVKEYKCHHCNKEFSRREHYCSAVDKKMRLRKTVCCHLCGKTVSESDFKDHVNRHLDIKEFKCDLCEYRCVAKKDLVPHRLTHTETKPFTCYICGAGFKTARSLSDHEILAHDQVKPRLKRRVDKDYDCPKCDFQCFAYKILKKHFATHHPGHQLDIEKLPCNYHKCDVCDKKFVIKGNLINHKLSHSKVRTFKCNLCDRSYKFANALRDHKAIMHNSTYVKHAKNVHECPECGFQCSNSYVAAGHVRNAHPNRNSYPLKHFYDLHRRKTKDGRDEECEFEPLIKKTSAKIKRKLAVSTLSRKETSDERNKQLILDCQKSGDHLVDSVNDTGESLVMPRNTYDTLKNIRKPPNLLTDSSVDANTGHYVQYTSSENEHLHGTSASNGVSNVVQALDIDSNNIPFNTQVPRPERRHIPIRSGDARCLIKFPGQQVISRTVTAVSESPGTFHNDSGSQALLQVEEMDIGDMVELQGW